MTANLFVSFFIPFKFYQDYHVVHAEMILIQWIFFLLILLNVYFVLKGWREIRNGGLKQRSGVSLAEVKSATLLNECVNRK